MKVHGFWGLCRTYNPQPSHSSVKTPQSPIFTRVRGLSKRPPFHDFSENLCGAGLLDLVMDRKMESIERHRRHAVEVFAQMPGCVIDLPILESSQRDQ